MKFNEDTRVKIPIILHLMKLGYECLSLKSQNWDLDTDIFPDIFSSAITRINPGIDVGNVSRLLEDVRLPLDNEDLRRAFFERLTDRSYTKLIDFENFNNNSFHVVTELICDSDKNIFSVATEDYITEEGLKKSSTRLFEKYTVFITASGSVFNSIVSNDIEFTNLALPRDRTIIEKLAAIAEPVFEKIETATRENKKLSSLRDWFLPMLMNGQVKVV